jgi:hypothetical protein
MSIPLQWVCPNCYKSVWAEDKPICPLCSYDGTSKVAEQLASQEQLDMVLKQEPDMAKRQALFAFMAPFIKRFVPQRPSEIIQPGVILKP